ncbi:hypothetical protein ACOTFH_10270 [Achromobacter xylosoxidans]
MDKFTEIMRRIFIRDDSLVPVCRYLFAICGGALFFADIKLWNTGWIWYVGFAVALVGGVFRSGGPIEDSSLLFCTLSARMAKVEAEEAVGG